MNTQKPEPRVSGDGSTLDLHSIFFTIQGEGPFAGHRSIFIRLAGCNLQCPGCDTEYTQGRQPWSVEDIMREVLTLTTHHNAGKCLIVLTGGEPLRQNIGMLLDGLSMMGHSIQIESNGVYAPDNATWYLIVNNQVSLVVSPKTMRIHPENEKIACAFKYVLDHRSVADDGLPIKALDHPAAKGVARPPAGKPVYINPYDAKDEHLNKLNLQAATQSAMRHGYILGVQLHKIIGVE